MKLDPMQIQALWHRTVSIVDEAAVGLVRTSHSQVVRDFNDFACGVFDIEGNMLAHSTRTTTLFIGVMPRVMKTFLTIHPAESWRPGDAVVTNDPWLGAGHTYDFCVASPIFKESELKGFAFSIVHHLDVGGRMGTTEARDVYEEGIRLPVLKLFQGGRMSPVAKAIIESNVRAPEIMMGDLNAQLVANAVCSRGLLQMLGDHDMDADALKRFSQEIRNRSERSLRSRIAALPDGCYRNSIVLPDIGKVSGINLQVRVEISGDRILVDYDGSSGEVPAAVNVPMAMTTSYTMYAIKLSIGDPEIPNNEGSFLPVSVRAPEGSLLNCTPPAPTWGRTMVAHHLPELILGALARVVPNRVMAASGSTPLITTRFAVRTREGGFRVGMNSSMGGLGATARKDGASCRGFPYNVSNIPIETIEHDLPVVYIRKELLTDSGGPGKYRGGLGQVFEVAAAPSMLGSGGSIRLGVRGSGRKEDSVHPVLGRAGGMPGRGEMLTLNGQQIEHGPEQVMKAGDTLIMAVPGGGGHGDPFKRDPLAVERDVALGYVSQESARSDYGVVMSVDGRVDIPATLVARESEQD